MPYHAGTPAVGMGLGPIALLERHGLAGSLGDEVEIGIVGPPDPERSEIARTFELARGLANLVSAARVAQRLPLVLAGNCKSCLGTVVGLARDRSASSGSTRTRTSTPPRTTGRGSST
jgi:arginase